MSADIDGFHLAYDRVGSGPAMVLLHGWPGDRTDYADVLARLHGQADVVVPDLRGFGESDKHDVDPGQHYGVGGQARSVIGLIEALGLDRPVLGGYDIGSRIAQTVARFRPDLVRGMVVTPPLPGVGARVLTADAQRAFWYQYFHRLDLAPELLDGNPTAVRAYLRHFWQAWSGPEFEPSDDRLDHLAAVYSPPGAFTASINWYRAGAGATDRYLAERDPDPADRITVPTTVLWPEHDPLFPRAWSDRIDAYFTDVRLEHVDGVGHFVPVEAADVFTAALVSRS
jgi:pimeloyl-ACP methyl ester carboxylesterase